MLPADFRKVCTSENEALIFFPPFFNGNFKEDQTLKLVSPSPLLWKQHLTCKGKASVTKALKNGLLTMTYSTFRVLLNQMETNWFFALVLREIISFPRFLCQEMQNRMSSIEERPSPNSLGGCPPWRSRGSGSTSFSLLISGSKHQHVDLRSNFLFQVELNYRFQEINCWPRTCASLQCWYSWTLQEMPPFEQRSPPRSLNTVCLSVLHSHWLPVLLLQAEQWANT